MSSMSALPLLDPVKYMNEGKRAFDAKEYDEAVDKYSYGIKADPTNIDLLANRAAAYLELRCFIRAVEDIKKVLKLQPNHVKGVYRMVKCLWGLGKYEEAKQFLKKKLAPSEVNESVELELDENKDLLIQLLDKTDKFIKQNTTGIYDVMEFFNNSNGKAFKHWSKDVGEFRGPVEIQPVEGKGRGLIATQDIKAGQVVICCKPFVIGDRLDKNEDEEDDLDMVTEDLKVRTFDNETLEWELLENNISNKIKFEPESLDELFLLYDGSELKPTTSKDSDFDFDDNQKNIRRQYDWEHQERVEQIVKYNSISITRKVIDSEELATLQTSPGLSKTSTRTTTGIWILPSYINHSCSEDNTIWEVYDDVMLVRAFKDIKKGEEILMSYMSPGSNFNLKKRQNILRSFESSCNCTLCYLEGRETATIIEKRETIMDSLHEELEKATSTDFDNVNINMILTAVDELEGLQSTVPKLNRCLLNPSLMLLIDGMLKNGRNLGNVLTLLDKIHFICSDSGLAIIACEVAIQCLECQFGIFAECALAEVSSRLKQNNVVKENGDGDAQLRVQRIRQDIERRMEVLKHDLIAAYGSLDMMNILGANVLYMSNIYGFKFFHNST